MTGKQGNKPAIPAGHQRARVRCMNGCTGNRCAPVTTWPEGEPAPNVLCTACKRKGAERLMMLSGKDKPKALDPEVWHGPPVERRQPGDKGFEEWEAECTPVLEIDNVSPAAAFVFDLQDRQRIIRREKREALANQG